MKKILPIIMLAVLMLSLAVFVSAERTVVYATKVDKAPNMEADTPFIDESWGEPAIVINSSSPNTELYKFWYKENPHIGDDYWGSNGAVASLLEPEDNDVELYYLWDSKYLYFGMKTLDSEPSGFVMPYMGDGFQMWLSTFSLLNGQEYAQSSYQENELDDLFYANHNNCDYYVTLDTSDWDSHSGAAAAVCDNEVWVDDDGYLYAYVRIPLANIGLNPKSNLHGVELATALLRISSRDVMDRGYSGWLAWGRYFYETNVDGMNMVVLVDPAQGMPNVDTEAPETEAPETEAPETEAPETTAPETEAPETTAPETEAPETEAPKTEAPETEAPETEAPETEAPETEAPETEAPKTEAPETEAPETEAPETEAPETEAPETEAPETEAPETEAPETEAPETEAPETEAPETTAPETSAPTTPAEPAAKNNTGLIIGIVAAVVVVGAVVGIVLGKKKKQ